MTPPAPAVVWDMGGVLYRYFTEVLADLGAARGWPLDGIPLGPTGPEPDPAYAAMGRGDIDEPAYVQIVRGRLAEVGVDVDPVAAIDWAGELRPGVLRAVERLHEQDRPQAVLTNDASRWLGAGWWETWPPAPWFDAILDVAEMAGRKPDPEPYLAAADALAVAPDRCLFVDDLPVNCRGAADVGMTGVLFDVTAPDAATAEVVRRAGLPADVTPERT